MKRGFTLAEILIVLAIVSVLAALFLPVTQRSRKAALRVSCTSHLRQIGVATSLYASDSDERLPAGLDPWTKYDVHQHPFPPATPSTVTLLLSYTKSSLVFRCPSDKGVHNRDTKPHSIPSLFDFVGSSFSFPNLPEGIALSAIPAPTLTVYSNDMAGDWHGDAQPTFVGLRWNWLYLDGHVKFGVEEGIRIRRDWWASDR